MKKLILVIALITISAVAVKAQEHFEKKSIFSVGAEVGVPVGTPGLNYLYSLVIGGSLQVEYRISTDFGLTLNAGYIHYLGKGGADGSGFVPVLAGFRYYFTPRVYGSGQLGISFPTSKGVGSSFTYSPGIGFQLTKHFDVLARYEGASQNGVNIGNLGVRVSYDF